MSGNRSTNEGVRILCAEDCGNAPKKVFIRDYEIAVAKNDFPVILESLTDDCICEVVGSGVFQGIERIKSIFQQETSGKLLELQIETILTHGYSGAANGILKFEDRGLAFCDIFHFNSLKQAKIKRITIYRIPVA